MPTFRPNIHLIQLIKAIKTVKSDRSKDCNSTLQGRTSPEASHKLCEAGTSHKPSTHQQKGPCIIQVGGIVQEYWHHVMQLRR